MRPLFESRYIDPASKRISHILSLLGPALLLPWPARCKGSRKKWKHLQLTDMTTPSHLAKLETADNIGVALGRASNGLVTIDVDDEDYIAQFLEANPLLSKTLRTTAQRGCNIWLRCTTGYPRSCRLKNRSGDEIGEWRADGNQTIVAGTPGCVFLNDLRARARGYDKRKPSFKTKSQSLMSLWGQGQVITKAITTQKEKRCRKR
jgi:bifunctional DNA primase/polymerase-like protein